MNEDGLPEMPIVYTYIHTYIHTNIHTYTHMNAYIQVSIRHYKPHVETLISFNRYWPLTFVVW